MEDYKNNLFIEKRKNIKKLLKKQYIQNQIPKIIYLKERKEKRKLK